MFKKKAQTAGLITGLIFGIASLVIAVIIAYVIVSTLTGAGLLTDGRYSVAVTNEHGYINTTGYSFAGASVGEFVSGGITVTSAFGNLTGFTLNNTVITAANYSVTSAGSITNITALSWRQVVFNYTYQLKSIEEASTENLEDNLTAGVGNVSSKIPTILLIAAIVLILGVLVLLVGVWQKMNTGGGSI